MPVSTSAVAAANRIQGTTPLSQNLPFIFYVCHMLNLFVSLIACDLVELIVKFLNLLLLPRSLLP